MVVKLSKLTKAAVVYRGVSGRALPQEFWQSKFASNVERDSRNRTDLQQLGWRVIVIWECELRQPSDLKKRLKGLFPQLDQNR